MGRTEEFNDVFNLTMTYRRDSDVYNPWGTTALLYKELYRENLSQYLDDLVARKSKVAVWVVNNGYMKAAQRRLQMTEELIAAGLDIDRMGPLFGIDTPECVFWFCVPEYHELVKTYKFYMAFENQWHSRDYISEKVWSNSFRSETVPVVWGATKADYEAVLPPNSFIFADDYYSQELADYLNYLDKNDTAYREYFNWRTMDPKIVPDLDRETGVCQLCRILHGINIDNIFNPSYEERYSSIPLFEDSSKRAPRIVHSLKEWFYDTDNPECY